MENIQKKKIALFSGRYNMPHIGHYRTIRKLAGEFDEVIVMILDYPKRKVPAQIVEQVMREDFEGIKNVKVVTNNLHFGKIKKADVERYRNIWKFTHYFAGNMDVLRNMSKYADELDYEIRWIDRSLWYEASKYNI